MKQTETIYKMMVLDTSQIEVPREKYQRDFNDPRAKKIAKDFDERIANEPKVSFRDGKYYVFDGQHTIAARKLLNEGKDLPVLCKVYFGMTAEEEALLFAKQTGESAPVTAGARIRAEIYGKDEIALAFLRANEEMGINLDYDQERGLNRIGCIKTAYKAYRKLGEERYKEAMRVIANAWNGEPDSFRSENVIGITRFVQLYHDEYDFYQLVDQLRHVDPMTIYREGHSSGTNFRGYKKYLHPVFKIYNGGACKKPLKLKF